MWGKSSSKKTKDAARDLKVAESQQALLESAVATADLAADVTRTMRKRMEDAIRQFESTARIMHDGLLICDLGGNVQAWNGVAELMFGLVAETGVAPLFEYSGSPLVNTDELYAVVKAKKRSLSGKHVDGTLFPVSVRMTVLERSDGSTVVLLAVQDMTLVNTVFESTFDASAVALNNGEIVAANPGVQRLFGYTPEELLGRDVNTIMNSFDRHGAALDLAFEVARMQWLGEDAVLITMRENSALPKKVAVKKRDNGVDMTCAYNASFKITTANPMFLKFHGLKKKDVVGSDVREHMPYDEVDDFTSAIRSLTAAEAFHRSHYIDESEDGVQVVQDWIDHAIFDASGVLVEVQRTGRDIGQAVAKAVAKRTP